MSQSVLVTLHRAVDMSSSLLVCLIVLVVNLWSLYVHPSSVVVLVMTAGCCVTAALGKVLKHLIAQPRPAGCRIDTDSTPTDGRTGRGVCIDAGMPSSHAVATSFLGVVACVGLSRTRPKHDAPHWRQYRLVELLVVLTGVYLARLRVMFGHHTAAQVVVGGLFGAACACVCLRWTACDEMGGHGGRLGAEDALADAARTRWRVSSVVVVALSVWHVLRRSSLLRRICATR